MEPTYTGVTTDLSGAFAAEATTLLDHVDHVEAEIEALHGVSERSVNALLADRHKEVGSTYRRAEVVSNLAIAEALDRLTSAVGRWHEVAASAERVHSREIYLSALPDGNPHR